VTTTIAVRRCDSRGRACEVLARYTPATPDRGPSTECAGGEPGDPEEIVVLGWAIVDEDCDTAEVLRDHAGLNDAIREAVARQAEAAACAEEDARGWPSRPSPACSSLEA
jgi:hypothetical protein